MSIYIYTYTQHYTIVYPTLVSHMPKFPRMPSVIGVVPVAQPAVVAPGPWMMRCGGHAYVPLAHDVGAVAAALQQAGHGRHVHRDALRRNKGSRKPPKGGEIPKWAKYSASPNSSRSGVNCGKVDTFGLVQTLIR